MVKLKSLLGLFKSKIWFDRFQQIWMLQEVWWKKILFAAEIHEGYLKDVPENHKRLVRTIIKEERYQKNQMLFKQIK